MGNSDSTQCPSHPQNKITRVCLCESCLQPMCETCVAGHHQVHIKLGYPAKLQPYDGLSGQYFSSSFKYLLPKEAIVAQTNLTPTSILIKDMTREYFQRQPTNENIGRVVRNLEIWNELRHDPQINRRISQFLRNNLVTNKQVVGKDVSHLY